MTRGAALLSMLPKPKELESMIGMKLLSPHIGGLGFMDGNVRWVNG